MKIKIIDLLVKIVNGEETINVKTKYDSFGWKENDFLSSIYYEFNSRTNAEIVEFLNNYVEIIEEPKKIEKIDEILMIDDLIPPYGENEYTAWKNIIIQQNKINELIDVVNELKRDK